MTDVAFEVLNRIMVNMPVERWIPNHPDGQHVAEYLIVNTRVLVSWDLSGDSAKIVKVAIVSD